MIKHTILVAFISIVLTNSAACTGTKEGRDLVPLIEALAEQRFTPITTGETPGFAVAVYKNSDPIYAKGFGLANLEFNAPIEPETKFYIASISKQFTAAILMQLLIEEKLSLSDSVKKYLAYLPDAYAQVTLADCLYHTGGVREYTSLLLFRGDDWQGQDRMSQDDALGLIKAQARLDFQPGTEYRYSSSGYVLLSAVIEQVTGQPLQTVAKERLFDPLGMTQTSFDADHGAVISNRAISYKTQNKGAAGEWRRWLKHFDVIGDGGILTTVNDMARWDAELTSGKLFGTKWQRLMHQAGDLKSGKDIAYGAGIGLTSLMGHRTYYHGGGMGGFIADYFRFPDLGYSILVMANRNDNKAFQGWSFAREILSLIAEPVPEEPSAAEPEKSVSPPEALADWQGAYFIESRNNRRYLSINDNGDFVLNGGGNTFIAKLVPQGRNLFQIGESNNRLRLIPDTPRKIEIITPDYSYTAVQYDDTPPKDISQLIPLTGKYCSEELDTRYHFYKENNRLMLKIPRKPPLTLFPDPSLDNITWNSLNKVWISVGMIQFQGTQSGVATGFTIGDSRVSGVAFDRCD